jgi:hypothetical protein
VSEDSEFDLVLNDVTVDIGPDGGTLRIRQEGSSFQFWVNGEPADQDEAWLWIYNWHVKRDAALGAEPCSCTPCAYWTGRALR